MNSVIDINEACKAVRKVFRFTCLGGIAETPDLYIIAPCGRRGETMYMSPFSVDKKTGEVDDYFPPDHDDFVNAVPVKIPEQYKVKLTIKDAYEWAKEICANIPDVQVTACDEFEDCWIFTISGVKNNPLFKILKSGGTEHCNKLEAHGKNIPLEELEKM